MIELLTITKYITLPALASMAAWVGKTNYTVSRNEKDLETFRKNFEQHMRDDAEAHKKIAKIDANVETVTRAILRLEDRLNQQ